MPDSRPLRPGEVESIGEYRLVGLLGEGGQGTVYLGETPSGVPVAVKVLHARLVADAGARTRFLREVELARRVAEFCTARVLDADVTHDRPYIVSEFVRGESLEELVRREGPRDRGALDRLAVGTAAALAAIHRAGIVHRDLKPSNVLLGPDGPRVIDFGIARMVDVAATLASEVQGTPSYMSPEQLEGWRPGPASDVFGWAVLMTFAATGRPAFGNDSIPAVMNRIMSREPDLDGVPERLRELLATCLAKDPRQRPTSDQVLYALMESDAEGLRAYGSGEPGDTLETTASPPPEPGTREGLTSVAGLEEGGARPATGTRDDLPPATGPVVDVTRAARPTRVRVVIAGVSLLLAAAVVVVPVVLLGQERDTPSAPRPAPVAVLAVGPRFGAPLGGPFTGHTADVLAVATATVDGRAVTVSAGRDSVVRVSEPGSRERAGRSFKVGTSYVSSLTAGEVGGRAVVVCGGLGEGLGGGLWVWDLARGAMLGRPFRGHRGDVLSVVLTELDGRSVVVSGGHGGLLVSDAATGKEVDSPLRGKDGEVTSLARAELDGRPVIVAAGAGDAVRVWDPADGRLVAGPYANGGAPITALTVGSVGGRPVILHGGDATVRVRDLRTGAPVGKPWTGHTDRVAALAVTELDGSPAVVSGSWDRTVRVWDLATGSPLGAPLTGSTGWVTSVAVTRVGDRPVVVAGGNDRAVRAWSLDPRR
ncbi:WD40 repeat domain-containing serine/threonine protein kinase [Streptosporangium sp. V21-05]|uniref:WD40 repeat domain-containing serine/threonine protein kinase n=1 Tax=Streptosporangium sp. V21-05 TaxID=3446115 RepID=UPI003F52A2B1